MISNGFVQETSPVETELKVKSIDIRFRPLSWSCLRIDKKEMRSRSICEAFGYTNLGQSIYVRISPPEIHLLEYRRKILDQRLSELSTLLNPDSIRRSKNNPRVAILINPTINPKELKTRAKVGVTSNCSVVDSYLVGQSVEITWYKSCSDPYGPLASLFSALKLSPYQWISIGKYQITTDFNTTAEIEITSNYDQLIPIQLNHKITPSRFFWDLEVYSSTGQFPKATNSTDVIFMGSGSHRSADENNDYLYHLKPMDPIKFPESPQPIVKQVETEGELITQILISHRKLKIDRSYTFNGYGFDCPYMAERSKQLGLHLPPCGKINKTQTNFEIESYRGPFKREYRLIPSLPGIEQLDLLSFFRKFYPELPNYHLDTIGKKLIGIGKTGLTISELNGFFRDTDSGGLKVGGKYSLQDSMLLVNLQELTETDQKLENLGNIAGMTTEDILRSGNQDISDRIMYQLDPGLYFDQGYGSDSPYIYQAKPGLYHSTVYVYDYSPLYVRALVESGGSLNLEISISLAHAYPVLIYFLFYSKVISRGMIDQLLNQYMSDIHSSAIFARTEYLIYSLRPLDLSKLDGHRLPKLIRQYRGYLVITKSSYITLDDDNIIVRYGSSDVCNPPFRLAKNVVDQYLKYFFGIGPRVSQININQGVSIDQLTLRTKIKDLSTYKQSGLRKTLSHQYGKNISTWIEVEWIQTDQGPLLLSEYLQRLPSVTSLIMNANGKVREIKPPIFIPSIPVANPNQGETRNINLYPPSNINYKWYANKLDQILKKISSLPIYKPSN